MLEISSKKICIEAKNIIVTRNRHKVLDNVSFVIKEGDYVGLIGPNGAGKTTLLHAVLGLKSLDSGSVEICGMSPARARKAVRIGYVPQRIAQTEEDFPASVEEVVYSGVPSGGRLIGGIKQKDMETAEGTMRMLGISRLRENRIDHLSGGEKQRVWIARALSMRPTVLILDEPTAGVDIGGSETLYSILGDLNKSIGLTIILVSHDVDVVARQVTTVLCLNKELVCHLPTAEFQNSGIKSDLYGQDIKHVIHDHD